MVDPPASLQGIARDQHKTRVFGFTQRLLCSFLWAFAIFREGTVAYHPSRNCVPSSICNHKPLPVVWAFLAEVFFMRMKHQTRLLMLDGKPYHGIIQIFNSTPVSLSKSSAPIRPETICNGPYALNLNPLP